MEVSKVLELKNDKVLIKLKNIFFKNNGNCFLDAYLVYLKDNNEWKIGLKAEGNKEKRKNGEKADNILLSKHQIDFLISKMQLLDYITAMNEKVNYWFGLENGDGLKKIMGVDYKGKNIEKYFKMTVEYNSHKRFKGSQGEEKEEKATFPLIIFVKNYENKFPVEKDKLLLTLFEFREILGELEKGIGSIDVEAVLNYKDGEMIYERPKRGAKI